MNALKILTFFLLATQIAVAGVINGDFSSNLDNWVNSNVTVTSGAADVSDGSGLDSSLFQGVSLSPGQYALDFDFLNQLSVDAPSGSFLDPFFASLYFINDIKSFDLGNQVFDNVQPLFDLDANGTTLYGGSVSPSPLGNGWLHFSTVFNNTFNYAIPTFELFNLNSIANDSRVLIDHVAITATPVHTVPEAETLTLLMSAISMLWVGRKHFVPVK